MNQVERKNREASLSSQAVCQSWLPAVLLRDLAGRS